MKAPMKLMPPKYVSIFKTVIYSSYLGRQGPPRSMQGSPIHLCMA
jgi:hypothetical protein